jgi:hypothetical protein
MYLSRKLTLAGWGSYFCWGLSVTEANAQRYGRYYGSGSYSGRYIQYQPRYYGTYNRRPTYDRYGSEMRDGDIVRYTAEIVTASRGESVGYLRFAGGESHPCGKPLSADAGADPESIVL